MAQPSEFPLGSPFAGPPQFRLKRTCSCSRLSALAELREDLGPGRREGPYEIGLRNPATGSVAVFDDVEAFSTPQAAWAESYKLRPPSGLEFELVAYTEDWRREIVQARVMQRPPHKSMPDLYAELDPPEVDSKSPGMGPGLECLVGPAQSAGPLGAVQLDAKTLRRVAPLLRRPFGGPTRVRTLAELQGLMRDYSPGRGRSWYAAPFEKSAPLPILPAGALLRRHSMDG